MEYKKSFNLKNASNYLKTMSSFANNKGGFILFGINDSPRNIIGISDKFDNFEQEKFTDLANKLFAPEMLWECGTVEKYGKKIGYIYTYPSENKPIIAQTNDNGANISNGDIFYRYHARTEKIKYPAMVKIFEERNKIEQERIFKLIEAIKNNANIGIVDYSNGHFTTPNGIDVAVDKKIVLQVLKKAKYIKSGSFNEKKGTPVIKVTGEINLAEETIVINEDPNITHPYLQKELSQKLQINSQELYALIWKLNIKGKKEYHIAIKTSSTSTTHKFSNLAYTFLKNTLEAHNDGGGWLSAVKQEYNAYRKEKNNSNGKIKNENK